MTFTFIVKAIITLFLIGWTLIGIYLAVNFEKIFGYHSDNPSETPGQRSFGIAHVFAVWIGGMALGIYFLSK